MWESGASCCHRLLRAAAMGVRGGSSVGGGIAATTHAPPPPAVCAPAPVATSEGRSPWQPGSTLALVALAEQLMAAASLLRRGSSTLSCGREPSAAPAAPRTPRAARTEVPAALRCRLSGRRPRRLQATLAAAAGPQQPSSIRVGGAGGTLAWPAGGAVAEPAYLCCRPPAPRPSARPAAVCVRVCACVGARARARVSE